MYVIFNNAGHCKIGKGNDPQKRLKQLSTGSATVLSLIHVVQLPSDAEAYRVEAAAHAALADRRCNGEWFNMAPYDAIKAVETARMGPAKP